MIRLLKQIRTFWWNELWSGVGRINKERRHRNDEFIETQRRISDNLFLERYGYKVYSQSDEDGIIEEIFNRIGTKSKIFVELGVGNGTECNTHYLIHKGWSGLWIDGDKKMMKEAQNLFERPITKGRLRIHNEFINIKNVNEIIGGRNGINGEVDLLSIDIDGNDYWIWEKITCINPRVVVIEYNAKFPPNHEWIMKYNESHVWLRDDQQGASLKSLELLGQKMGYQLVGTNFTGINAFFVKVEMANDLFPKPAIAENLYNCTRWNIQYSSGHPSKKYIGE